MITESINATSFFNQALRWPSISRRVFSLSLALFLTLLLFQLMLSLIDKTYVYKLVERPIQESPFMPDVPIPIVLPEKLVPPEPIDTPPPTLALVKVDVGHTGSTILIPPVAPGPKVVGPSGNFQEGEAIPYLRSAPIYPSRQLTRGIEGFVDLSFSITKTGATDSITVLQAVPEGAFERAAVRAVQKWKYKPQIVGGLAVRKDNQTTRVSFAITE